MARCPVLLVGPSIEAPPAGPPRLVVGYDGSERSASCTPTVIDLAHTLQATVALFEVVPPALLASMEEGVLPDPIRDRFVSQLRSAGVDADRTVRYGHAAEKPVASALQLDATYVIVATHGRTGLARIALGSIAMRVVRLSPCPVVVVRPRQLALTEISEGQQEHLGFRVLQAMGTHEHATSRQSDHDRVVQAQHARIGSTS
jgi:nucleotide-binding universal stress UspA family protein